MKIQVGGAKEINLGKILSFGPSLSYEDQKPRAIIITKGLISLLPPEQLEATVAHEIGHIVLGHLMTGIIQNSPAHFKMEREADKFVEKLGVERVTLKQTIQTIVTHLPSEAKEMAKEEFRARFPEE